MKKSTSVIISGLAFAAVLLIGYLVFPGESGPSNQAKGISFGYDDVKNYVYDGMPLVDGKSVGDERGEASVNSRRSVSLFPEFSASGDIDGDGAFDFAVLAVEDFGGDEFFSYISLYYSRGELVQYAGKIFLGDRIRVRSISIAKDKSVSATVVSHESEDSLYSPTKIVALKYEIRPSGPVEISREDLGRVQEESEE